MKKMSMLFIAAMSVLSVLAEGYQVNLQSVKQTGMGHVGASMKLGAESMHFNPAGLAFTKNAIDISLGASCIFSEITYKDKGTGIKEHTDNSVSTPLYAYASFKIYDNLSAGISFTTPYGSSLNWGKNWSGADLVQDISLKAYVVQPTVSYKILPNLSIGAGLMIGFGNVELSRALLPAGSIPTLPGVIPVSATLTGNSAVRVGYNVGAMWDITDRLTVGASFRSKVSLKVKEGTARLDYANEQVKQFVQQNPSFPKLDEGTFSAEMPMPANLNIGASYRLGQRWLLAAEIQTVFWKAYDELSLQFTEEVLGGYNITARKDYKNTLIYRLGAECEVTNRLDLRAGIYYDQTPIRSDLYNPETPGMDKLGMSVGLSFRPIKSLSVDFAFLYIQGIGKDGSYPHPEISNPGKLFEGHYTSQAFTPTLGVTYRY
ncbi:outer membrane protein transport protein [Barnesiella propionica]|uniref:OmpP1/FadL family transporter n=1 Tax=Barnesiella propionica TaxID=2981781 RepID=UPI0011C9A734|nr:outer membrane protein transport protein [Barnesiella propionica]MCU6769870.1 outer membrane protein transport protein [Barnesiella propionica]